MQIRSRYRPAMQPRDRATLAMALAAFGLAGVVACSSDADDTASSTSGPTTTASNTVGSGGETSSSSVGGGGAGGGSAGGGGADICEPATTQACYSGPNGTEGVGICAAGSQTCAADGSSWGTCGDEVLPASIDDCTTAADDNCDGVANDGCLCTPGEVSSCYTGPAGTQGVGTCQAGDHTCSPDGQSYSACSGEVLPAMATCTMPLVDEDCDGNANNGCCASGSWSVETVDTVGSLGTVRALHVDDDLGIHLLYLPLGLAADPQPNEVRYAYRPRGGNWTFEVVAAFAGLSVTPLDMALDPAGQPHVVYREGSGTRYAWRTMMGWSVENLPGVSSPTGGAIGVDAMGQVYGAFRSSTNVRRAGRSTMGVWSVTTMTSGVAGTRIEGAMANDGRFHVLYTEPACSGCSANTLWHRSILQDSVTAAVSLNQAAAQNPIGIDTDANALPHAAFRAPFSNFAVAANNGMMWTDETCQSPICPTIDNWVGMAVDAAGDEHAAYASSSTVAPFYRLVHATRANASWSYEEIVPLNNWPRSVELDMDTSGGAHVAFAEQGGSNLFYGYRCP